MTKTQLVRRVEELIRNEEIGNRIAFGAFGNEYARNSFHQERLDIYRPALPHLREITQARGRALTIKLAEYRGQLRSAHNGQTFGGKQAIEVLIGLVTKVIGD